MHLKLDYLHLTFSQICRPSLIFNRWPINLADKCDNTRNMASSETHPLLIRIDTEHRKASPLYLLVVLLWEINQSGKHRYLNKAAKLC